MFDTAATQDLAAVQKSDGGQKSDAPTTVDWTSIRRHCKDVMVCLESLGQHTNARAIKVKQLDSVAPSVTKHKERSLLRILTQSFLGCGP